MCSQFGATATVELEVPRSEIDRIRSEVDDGIDDVTIEPDTTLSGSGGTGVTSGGSLTDLLAEQNELIDDIRDEVLSEGGSLLGVGGKGGNGGGGTNILTGPMPGGAGAFGTAATLLGASATGVGAGLAGVKLLEDAGINDSIEGLGEDLGEAIPNNQELAGGLSLGSELFSQAGLGPDVVGIGAASRDFVTGSGGERLGELEGLEQEFVDSVSSSIGDVSAADLITVSSSPAAEIVDVTSSSASDIIDPVTPEPEDVVRTLEASAGDIIDIGRLDDPSELLEPNIGQLDDLGSVIGPKIPQIQNPQNLIDIAEISDPASILQDAFRVPSGPDVPNGVNNFADNASRAIDSLTDNVSVSINLSPNFDIQGLSGNEVRREIEKKIDEARDDIVQEAVNEIKDSFRNFP